MLKFVFDTNIIISAFFWEGNEAQLLRRVENKEAELYLSFEIIYEVESVLKRKFNKLMIKSGTNVDEIIQKLISLSNIVIGDKLGINISRDHSDNKILECAKLAKVNIIVTGDMDLLVLKKFEDIQILRTEEALKLLK